MADQTVSPYGDQVVAHVDDLTNEQFAKFIVQAQRVFGSGSQQPFGENAAACGRAGVGVTLVAVHRHNRQSEEAQ
jgi:hypothetical protein